MVASQRGAFPGAGLHHEKAHKGEGLKVNIGRQSKMTFGIFGMLALIFPALAGATSQGPITIAFIGSHGSTGYVGFSSPLADNCNWNHLYFSVDDNAGQATLSILMTAHVSGRPLTRVDYSKDAHGTCWITLAQI